MGDVSRKAMPNNRKLKIFQGPCILVARKGFLGGTMTHIKNKDFAMNDDAYVMILKKKWKDKLNLRWFIYQYQNLFYNIMTSKTDNATFNKSSAMKQKILVPNKETTQDAIAKKLLMIDNLRKQLIKIRNQLEYLLTCELEPTIKTRKGIVTK
jgi:hypothetical protein